MLPMGGDPPSRGIASDPVFPEELEDAPGRVPPGQQPVAGTSRWSAQPMIGRAHPFDCQRPCLDSFQNVRKGTDVVAAEVDPDEAALMVLRAAGLRVTAPRRAVLSWLVEHPHATADAIGEGVREMIGTVSTQAVYDVLGVCAEAGLLRRIEPAGHPARFERRVGDNHHHIVCRLCGRTDDVDCAVGTTPCLEPSDVRGFTLDEAEVVFWGLCPGCATEGRPADGFRQQEEIRQ